MVYINVSDYSNSLFKQYPKYLMGEDLTIYHCGLDIAKKQKKYGFRSGKVFFVIQKINR